MWLYFRKVPNEMLADPGEQLQKVLDFRSQIESERAFLFRTYDDAESWERQFRQHLARWLDDLPPFVAPPSGVEIPPEFEERLRRLEQDRLSATDADASAQARLTETANRLGRHAIEAARAGRFTEAETLFASSLDLHHDPDVAYAYARFRDQFEKRPKEPFEKGDALATLGIDVPTDDRSLAAANLLSSLLSKGDIRELIDTLTTKVVLILGRFTAERRAILDALKQELANSGYVPVLFDTDKPQSRDVTETISTIAHLSRFIVADLTDARAVPSELAAIVPSLPSVPVVPMLASSGEQYAMFSDLKRYPWILDTYRYRGVEDAIANLNEKLIAPAEAKVQELRRRVT